MLDDRYENMLLIRALIEKLSSPQELLDTWGTVHHTLMDKWDLDRAEMVDLFGKQVGQFCGIEQSYLRFGFSCLLYTWLCWRLPHRQEHALEVRIRLSAAIVCVLHQLWGAHRDFVFSSRASTENLIRSILGLLW